MDSVLILDDSGGKTSIAQSSKKLLKQNFHLVNGISSYPSDDELAKTPPLTSTPTTTMKTDFCQCCPYGFHIDTDFVPYCQRLLTDLYNHHNTYQRIYRKNFIPFNHNNDDDDDEEKENEVKLLETFSNKQPDLNNGGFSIVDNGLAKPLAPLEADDFNQAIKMVKRRTLDIVNGFHNNEIKFHHYKNEEEEDFFNILFENSKPILNVHSRVGHSRLHHHQRHNHLGQSPTTTTTSYLNNNQHSCQKRDRNVISGPTFSDHHQQQQQQPFSQTKKAMTYSSSSSSICSSSACYSLVSQHQESMLLSDVIEKFEEFYSSKESSLPQPKKCTVEQSNHSLESDNCFDFSNVNKLENESFAISTTSTPPPSPASLSFGPSGVPKSVLTQIRNHLAQSLSRVKELENQVSKVPGLLEEVSRLKSERELLLKKLNNRRTSIVNKDDDNEQNNDDDEGVVLLDSTNRNSIINSGEPRQPTTSKLSMFKSNSISLPRIESRTIGTLTSFAPCFFYQNQFTQTDLKWRDVKCPVETIEQSTITVEREQDGNFCSIIKNNDHHHHHHNYSNQNDDDDHCTNTREVSCQTGNTIIGHAVDDDDVIRIEDENCCLMDINGQFNKKISQNNCQNKSTIKMTDHNNQTTGSVSDKMTSTNDKLYEINFIMPSELINVLPQTSSSSYSSVIADGTDTVNVNSPMKLLDLMGNTSTEAVAITNANHCADYSDRSSTPASIRLCDKCNEMIHSSMTTDSSEFAYSAPLNSNIEFNGDEIRLPPPSTKIIKSDSGISVERRESTEIKNETKKRIDSENTLMFPDTTGMLLTDNNQLRNNSTTDSHSHSPPLSSSDGSNTSVKSFVSSNSSSLVNDRKSFMILNNNDNGGGWSIQPSTETRLALETINANLLEHKKSFYFSKSVTLIKKYWFKISSNVDSDYRLVESFLDFLEKYSTKLLDYVVNFRDSNGNTAMHYAISYNNFDIVSVLLDSKFCDLNKFNKAGYTAAMLVSLAKIENEVARDVVERLFNQSDVNMKAKQNGQTALMLAASHGRIEISKILLDCGAGVNLKDNDGSTALMCAAEHGHAEVLSLLLAHPDCDPQLEDHEGSTALKIALINGHNDCGILLYAGVRHHYSRHASPALMTSYCWDSSTQASKQLYSGHSNSQNQLRRTGSLNSYQKTGSKKSKRLSISNPTSPSSKF